MAFRETEIGERFQLLVDAVGHLAGDAVPLAHAVVEPATQPSHPLGRHKARVFESALGYRQADFHDLIDQIRQGILHSESEATDPVPHGDRFRVDVPIAGPGGRVVVRTLWIIRKNEDVPRLTSAYPIK